jgi:hypothetical protein
LLEGCIFAQRKSKLPQIKKTLPNLSPKYIHQQTINLKDTVTLYDDALAHCRALFEQKTTDYGTAWRVLRLPSLTDQLYIKAQRIRTLEENGSSAVGEGIEPEFVGIVNYCIMALIQLNHPPQTETDWQISPNTALQYYDQQANYVRQLMLAKNTDYGDAWRYMRISSYTDLILMKLLRVKQIENNKGQTLVSEGIEANYADMMNYALFALIKLHQ